MPPSSAEPTLAPGSPGSRAGRWAPWWVIAFVALWPLPGIAEGVLVLGALYAAVRMVQLRLQGKQRLLSSPAWALTSILFLGYWLPQAFSAFDAIDPGTAWRKAAAGLRYLPFMWLVAIAVATPQRRALTLGGLALITGLWTVDALAQAIVGTSPLFWSMDQLKWAFSGHGLCAPEEMALVDRLSGVLGPCNL
ncbi:MAG: O-antigen ligase family protein, partial [Stenotrophomonas maltophilia]